MTKYLMKKVIKYILKINNIAWSFDVPKSRWIFFSNQYLNWLVPFAPLAKKPLYTSEFYQIPIFSLSVQKLFIFGLLNTMTFNPLHWLRRALPVIRSAERFVQQLTFLATQQSHHACDDIQDKGHCLHPFDKWRCRETLALTVSNRHSCHYHP